MEEYQETLASSLEEIDRISRIVEELFLLSKADLGEARLEKAGRPRPLFKETLTQMELLAKEKAISLRFDCREETTITGDSDRLRGSSSTSSKTPSVIPRRKENHRHPLPGEATRGSPSPILGSAFRKKIFPRSSTASIAPIPPVRSIRKEAVSGSRSADGSSTHTAAPSRSTAPRSQDPLYPPFSPAQRLEFLIFN